MKYAGVVVTYNRKYDLVKNIERVLQQTKPFDVFYIIDNNSTDGTFDFLIDNNIPINEIEGNVESNTKDLSPIYSKTKIVYVELPENIGGAGGFCSGMEKAFNDGNDFIVLMDDDGRPVRNDCFERLYDKAVDFYKDNKLLMMNSLVVGSDEYTLSQCNNSKQKLSFGLGNANVVGDIFSFARDGIIYQLINPFNGTLVTKELLSTIGFVNKDFFIRGDEVDFQSRASKANAIIATIVDSVYYHPACELFNLRWKGRIVSVGTAVPWKSYYLVRNYTYRIKRDSGFIDACKFLIFHLYSTIKVDKCWKKCMHMIFKGFNDGIRGRLGKRVNPGDK